MALSQRCQLANIVCTAR